MLSRGNTIVQRQEGERENDDVRIHSVQSTPQHEEEGYCQGCGHWTVELKKIGKAQVCSSCKGMVEDRLNQRA